MENAHRPCQSVDAPRPFPHGLPLRREGPAVLKVLQCAGPSHNSARHSLRVPSRPRAPTSMWISARARPPRRCPDIESAEKQRGSASDGDPASASAVPWALSTTRLDATKTARNVGPKHQGRSTEQGRAPRRASSRPIHARSAQPQKSVAQRPIESAALEWPGEGRPRILRLRVLRGVLQTLPKVWLLRVMKPARTVEERAKPADVLDAPDDALCAANVQSAPWTNAAASPGTMRAPPQPECPPRRKGKQARNAADEPRRGYCLLRLGQYGKSKVASRMKTSVPLATRRAAPGWDASSGDRRARPQQEARAQRAKNKSSQTKGRTGARCRRRRALRQRPGSGRQRSKLWLKSRRRRTRRESAARLRVA